MISLLELLYYGNQHTKTVLGKWKYDQNDIKSKKYKMCTVKDINEKQFLRGYQNHGFKIRKNTMKKYSQLFKKYLKYRFKNNTNKIFLKQGLNNIYQTTQGDQQTKSDYFYISKLLSQTFQFGQVNQQFSEQKFIRMLRKLRSQQNDQQFLKFYILIIQKQSQYLQQFDTQFQKVNCLKKKFNYLILRQIYFFLYYDIDCLQQKSSYSKKNYQLYQNRILQFYQQIIAKSYQDFIIKKQMELKKRSIYLQNYLLKYQNQPQLAKVQKNLNKLLVCVFNQIMLIYTQDIKMEIKKKGQQLQNLNHKIKNNTHQPLHTHYLSSQFYADKSLPKEESQLQQDPLQKNQKIGSNATINNGPNFKQPNQFGANMSILNALFPGLLNQRQSKKKLSFDIKETVNQKKQQANGNQIISQNPQNHKKATFKVFTINSMNLHQSISIYQQLHNLNNTSIQKYFTELKQKFSNTKSLKRDDLTQMQIKTLQTNEQSIVSLLKRQIIQKINQMKFQLVQKNLISRIQKLYINLDVRHKVFESFKDKILSYQMQKAKIYHQYMDYIRGLKLDVYSHIANQDSLPYIKILNAIKFYRLQVKKQQLQNKVRQQFGKNLRKWNQGIQQDIKNYNQWLSSQQKQWQIAKIHVQDQKNQLLLIYDAIKKQLKRQSKKKQVQQQKVLKHATTQFIKNQLQNFIIQPRKSQKTTKQLKKIGMSKKNLFMVQKQKLDKVVQINLQKEADLFKNQKISQNKLNKVNIQNSQTPQNLFMAVKIEKQKLPIHLTKSISMHALNHRSLSKHSSMSKNKKQRPTTSMYSEKNLSSSHTVTVKKQRDMNRVSTAVTRQKSLDAQGSQFRGIKMKFISKSLQKFLISAQSNRNQQKNFKRSTDYSTGVAQRIFSGHHTNKNQYVMPSSFNNNDIQSKSRTLLKQARNVSSAMPQRKGIIKNF